MADRDQDAESVAEVRRLGPTISLAAQGAGSLREMILNGVLTPGQRLNEVELSAALGISRAPLREAIRDLASQGLLTTITHKGAFVPSSDDLRDIYEVRIALETHAVRLLSLRRSAADVADLHALLDQTEETLGRSAAQAYPDHLDFHHRLLELTGNQQLVEIGATVDRKIQLARIRSGHVPKRAREAFYEHRQIIERLSDADPNAVAELMMRHLQLSLANALRISEPASDLQVPLPATDVLGGSSA